MLWHFYWTKYTNYKVSRSLQKLVTTFIRFFQHWNVVGVSVDNRMRSTTVGIVDNFSTFRLCSALVFSGTSSQRYCFVGACWAFTGPFFSAGAGQSWLRNRSRQGRNWRYRIRRSRRHQRGSEADNNQFISHISFESLIMIDNGIQPIPND